MATMKGNDANDLINDIAVEYVYFSQRVRWKHIAELTATRGATLYFTAQVLRYCNGYTYVYIYGFFLKFIPYLLYLAPQGLLFIQ
jgi:hypothetical protein